MTPTEELAALAIDAAYVIETNLPSFSDMADKLREAAEPFAEVVRLVEPGPFCPADAEMEAAVAGRD